MSRWIFAAAAKEYQDIRIERDQWNEMKKNLPFGVPYLEMDDFKLSQSNTIARFLARRFGLAGKNELEEAKADMVVDCVEEMLKPLFHLMFYATEDQKSDLAKRWEEEQKPTFLRNLENLLISNNGGDGYFVGDGLTWADMSVAFGLTWIKDLDYGPYPKLKALKERVESNPGISAWIAKRPPSDF